LHGQKEKISTKKKNKSREIQGRCFGRGPNRSRAEGRVASQGCAGGGGEGGEMWENWGEMTHKQGPGKAWGGGETNPKGKCSNKRG